MATSHPTWRGLLLPRGRAALFDLDSNPRPCSLDNWTQSLLTALVVV